MEEQNNQAVVNNSQNSTPKFVFPTVIASLIVLAVIGYYFYNQSQNSAESVAPGSMTQTSQSPASSSLMTQTTGTYKNGTYNVKGNYVSPGGPREVGVSLTLTDGVITDATAEVLATDATSKRFQTEFVEGFKPMVIGKKLDEVSLTKVSGSSLTPKGFNDAVIQIKAEAQS